MFPQADTKIRKAAHTFLRRMKAVLDELGTFDTRITLEPPSDAWMWRVGPDRSFIVCAQRMTRRP